MNIAGAAQLPASFAQSGFVLSSQLKLARGIMVGIDGPPDSGKTELAMSAPGPGMMVCLDRMFDGAFDNPNPPPTRQGNFGIAVVKAPVATQAAQDTYATYWSEFKRIIYSALENKDARTVVIDGDSDSWELQRLAAFGKLTKIPSIMYDEVNAARRALYARCWDSRKVIIATNKVGKQYVTKYKADGTPDLNASGQETRVWSGDYERKGFSDQDYLWHMQLRTMYDPAKGEWGLRIVKCKANKSLEGQELWGADCNFPTLLQNAYPNVSLREWGYK